MEDYKKYILAEGTSIKVALERLDHLAADAVAFVVNAEHKLIGSITDGDVRRGFLGGLSLESPVEHFINKKPRFFRRYVYDISQVIAFRKNNYRIVPVLDDDGRIVNVVNFRLLHSYLPLDAVIMAGGRGERLRPWTDEIPKPLLKIGDKPILEHNIDRLKNFGVEDFWICVRYLGKNIEKYFGTGDSKRISIKYVWEDEPLGTIGAASKITEFKHDHILVLNSDILTDVDFEDYYLDFVNQDAAMSVVTIPYNVSVPYAVLETTNGHVISLKEKPTYTYYSNGGIYLLKRSVFDSIPENGFFNATDLMETLISKNAKVISYPLRGYWLDIGRKEDFEKASKDIHHLKL